MTDAEITIPERHDPEKFPEDKRELYKGVSAALAAIPVYFDFDNPISGINATDLHSLSNLMGAAIEIQVVETLNAIRGVWDRDQRWAEYSFVRSSQAFPDVRLTRQTDNGLQTVMGIELKGWFLLAKEGMPSLRYQVSPDACWPWDLVCVVPWHLTNAVSGTPRAGVPWVEQARYAAEWRDHWWQHIRGGDDTPEERAILPPESASPYPSKADLVSMKPVKDGGGNYGRLPRCKPLMDTFIAESLRTPVLGIEAIDWQAFLKVHSENADPDAVAKKLASMDKRHGVENAAERLRAILRELATDFDFT